MSEVGGVLLINDYFFSVGDMVDFLKYNYTPDEMITYYDYRLDRQMSHETCINIKNWKKLRYDSTISSKRRTNRRESEIF